MNIAVTLIPVVMVGMGSSYLTAHATIDNLQNRVGRIEQKTQRQKVRLNGQAQFDERQQNFREKVISDLATIKNQIKNIKTEVN